MGKKENITENRLQSILELIGKNEKTTISEIASRMGVVRRTIARDIEQLKRKGVIVRIGADCSL